MKIHLDSPAEEVQIQIIPLIDVIFCILTFFILAALQLTRQSGIVTDLPKANTGTPLPELGLGDTRFREMLIVSISPTGQIFVDQQPVDRSQLYQLMANYVQQNPKGVLALYASPTVFYNDVVQVLDLMRSVGGNRVFLATLPSGAPASPGASPPPGSSPFPTTSPTFDPFNPLGTPAPGGDLGSPTSPTLPLPGLTSPPSSEKKQSKPKPTTP